MLDLAGYTSVALLFLITLCLALRWPDIFHFIFAALIIRVLILLLGQDLITLPDSTADAETFERMAWEMGQEGYFYVLSNYPGPSPHFISWLIAIPYSFFGRSLLMAQSISLLFGIGSVFLSWKTASLLWNNNIANKVGWMIALFPTLILYSVLVMREAYIVFFIVVALYGVITWFKTDNFKSIIIAMIGFIGATYFHGGMFVGIIVFTLIISISVLQKIFKALLNHRIRLKNFVLVILIVAASSYYFSNKLRVPYLGTFKSTSNLMSLMSKTNVSTRGTAAWPRWTVKKSPIELLYKGPVRSIYIMFSPFPWEVNKIKHLIGMLDSFIYMCLSFIILRNIKTIWRDPISRTILIILLSYIFVFGFGVGNFGTGIRHRSKFVIMFILLAAPFIPKFVFLKKENLNKSKIN